MTDPVLRTTYRKFQHLLRTLKRFVKGPCPLFSDWRNWPWDEKEKTT